MADSPLRMPDRFIQRAQSIAQGDGQWVAPPCRDAATVVLVMDTPDGVSVFLQKRPTSMAFAPGVYVFPGGAVEPIDYSDTNSADTRADTPACRAAAIRETAEEAQIELGSPDALSFIAHWVTPELEDRRFDTRFYAAVIDEQQAAIAQASTTDESDENVWISPKIALAASRDGQMLMLPPTVAVLNDLAQHDGQPAHVIVERLADTPTRPLMPHPIADDSPAGFTWVLIDVATNEHVALMSGPPRGSESSGTRKTTTE